GVLVHELAHLKYSGHGQDFRDFAARYPRMSEVDAFLEGVSFAQDRGKGKTFPDALDLFLESWSSSKPPSSNFLRSSSSVADCSSAEVCRGIYPSGSSRSSSVGRRSWDSQMASRYSIPSASWIVIHSFVASCSRRGRKSRPTREPKACSAGPPEARRRLIISRSALAESRGLAASVTTTSTQPSMSASNVSK